MIRLPVVPALALVVMFASAAGVPAQEPTQMAGTVVRAGDGAPLPDAIVRLADTDVSAVSDAQGRFVLRGVPAGAFTLEVRHAALGTHALPLSVARPGERFEVRLTVSEGGVSVEVLDAAASEPRGPTGTPQEGRAAAPVVTVREAELVAPPSAPALRAGLVLDRERILRLAGSSRDLADLLRRGVPALQARLFDTGAGGTPCLEFRSAATTSFQQARACNHPQVYLDGIPLVDPAAAYGMTAFEALQWVQAIPPNEAGAQFAGASYGVILVTTVSGARSAAAAPADATLLVRSRRTTFDWEQDPAGHPFLRAFALSAVGAAAGLAAGREAWGRCVYVDDATQELERTCPRGEVAGMGLVAVALPALGSAVGAHLGGRTAASEGRWVPALVGAGLALLPGYGYSLATVGDGAAATNTAGKVFLMLGTPLAAALADRMYRRLRPRN